MHCCSITKREIRALLFGNTLLLLMTNGDHAFTGASPLLGTDYYVASSGFFVTFNRRVKTSTFQEYLNWILFIFKTIISILCNTVYDITLLVL